MRSLINIRRMIFGVVLVCVLGLPAYGQYCSASGGSSGCYEYISRVQVGTIDNSTSQNCGYADHTSLSTTMEIGTGYSITVNNGDPWSGDQCGIWVDWNADEDFDDVNETIVMSGGPGTFTGTITPPADAVVGNTRLRIRIRYTGTLDPCGDTPWGEVEDYTITIPPNEDCDTIAIGSGTSVWAYPMYTYYHDSRTQVIYLASEIGSEGTITALGLDVATVPGQIMNNWTIRMKHTTMSSYSTASLDATGWTIVYQGNEPIGITGWRTFNFSTPFEYNGSDNLLVDFSHNNTSYSTYGMCRSSAPGGTRSAYARSDSGYGDPLNWSGTTSPTVYGTTSIPNVKLTICQETSPTVNISGYVKTAQGVRIKGAIVSASTGPNTVTDALGHYMLTLPSPFSGTITAAQTDWTFDARLYLGQTSDLVDENLTGTYNVGYGGGSGTSSSPYLIYNAAQLNAIGAKALDWGKYFRLMADIDLSGYDGKEGRPSFNRIGYYINFVGNFAFTGVFDGYGHTISNFTFDSDAGNDGVGIFGYMNASGAQVKNVKLINVDVNSTSYIGTGGLVGYILNGMVSGCSVQGGIVSAVDDVGGLAGMVWEGTISDCNVAVGVSGEWSVGGLLGGTGTGGVVSDCRASCTVTGKVECGGLIGDIGSDNGTAIRCSTAGDVMINYGSILDRTAGGIAGSSSGTVRYCYSTANVIGNGANEIGGLVGRNAGGSISNCYASGAATGKTYIGGLIGVCWDSNIVNCYSVGPVSGTGSYEGGLIGEDVSGNSQVIGSFWDKQTSGLTTSAGGTGKTTAEMQTEATFLAAGWDFEIETANGNETIWYIEPNDYPRLCWEAGIKYGGGTGEPDDPYLIYTSEQMNEIGTDSNDWRKSFKLMADISLSAYGGSLYNIIGRSSSPIPSGGPFYGTFDGNYHSISGFSYSRNSINYVGIFGFFEKRFDFGGGKE